LLSDAPNEKIETRIALKMPMLIDAESIVYDLK
jgi:hypothetical protein